MLELYKNIRKLRKNNRWTQEELASRMGYTDRSMIAKIESGKVDLSQSKILEFAKVFGVDAGDLLGAVESSVTDSEQNTRSQEFVKLFENVDPVVQESIVNLLKSSQPKS